MQSIRRTHAPIPAGVGLKISNPPGSKNQVILNVENAKKILNHDYSSELEELEDQFPELGKDDLCTKCGSSNLSVVNTTRKAGALSLLLHLPLIIFRKRYKCLDCGNIMKK